MKQIAEDFNAKGYRNTIGRKFSIDAISRMLQNRHYIGEYKFKDIVIQQVMRFFMDDEAIDELVDILMRAQKKENTTLPLLKQELREVEKSIKNMLDAIQNGIFTSSTKQRLEELEARKEDLEISIAREQMFKPLLESKKIKFFLHQFRKLDTTKLEHRRSLSPERVRNFCHQASPLPVADTGEVWWSQKKKERTCPRGDVLSFHYNNSYCLLFTLDGGMPTRLRN